MKVRREEHQHGTLAEQFRRLCREQDTFPDVFAFLESAAITDPQEQADVLLVDQALRIADGRLRPVEEYFARFPEVAARDDLCLRLVAGEFRHRTQQGDAIDAETFLARFPRLEDRLGPLLDTAPDETLSSPDATVEISMESIFRPVGQDTVDLSMDRLDQESDEKTVEVSMESLFADANEEDGKTIEVSMESLFADAEGKESRSHEKHPRSTVDWDATEGGMDRPAHVGDDTSQDVSHETLQMTPQTLNKMFEEFGTLEVTGTGSPRPIGRGVNTPDTLFDEGVAYDRDRRLGQFGEYELLSEIARGGMGVVFKARQRKLKRIVALKMILAGTLADAEDIRRFYAEAEAAAALDHPHIVPVYEVGQYRGQHFFSMGYVEGQSLADEIADHPLSAHEAAAMMKMIAEAVEYAHRHGVVHRDLKPANVLLDAQGQPKITDFGLAKRTEADAELTNTGQIMGTPSYMSPEQVSGDSSKVGPLSDVFSLGGMLYCLLTGRPPFQAPNVLDLLKKVKNEEPVSPRRLTANLPVDLETICLKCLAKEPARRYESAQALADDLDRFLKGIPVLARPVGNVERAWRWCKRYPVVAGLIAAVVVSLTAGAAVSTYYAIAANRRAKEALEQFARAEENYVRAEENFARAEQNFRKAQAAVDQFFVQVSENTLLNQPGMQPLQHELLNQALVYYQEFLKERGDDPELQDELAVTNFRVGIITEIVESPQAAIPAFEKSRELQTKLLKADADDPEFLRGLGNTLTALGRVYFKTQGYRHAEEIYQEAVDTRQRLVGVLPDDHEAQRELANAYMNLGLIERGRGQSLSDPAQRTAAFEKALTFYTKAQQYRRGLLDEEELSRDTLRKVHRDFGQGGYNLGMLHFQMGQIELGLQSCREAAAQFEKALQIDPADQSTTLQLSVCYRILAERERDPNQALSLFETALSRLDPLVRANPEVDDYRRELVTLRGNLGETTRRLNKPDEARRHFQEARRLIEPLIESHPQDLRLLLKALSIYRSLFDVAQVAAADSPEVPSAEAIQQLANRVQQQVIAPNAGGRLRGDFAVELFKLGQQLDRHGQAALALEVSRQGVEITGRLAEEEPANRDYRFNHQFGLGQVGRLLTGLKQVAQAENAYRQRLVALSGMADLIRDNAAMGAELNFERAKTHNALAMLALQQENRPLAQKDLQEARRLIEGLMAQLPEHRAFFEVELKQTLTLQRQVSAQPAVAEKPKGDALGIVPDGGPR